MSCASPTSQSTCSRVFRHGFQKQNAQCTGDTSNASIILDTEVVSMKSEEKNCEIASLSTLNKLEDATHLNPTLV